MKRPGYVMMLTLTIIALLTVLVTYVSKVANTYGPLAIRVQEQLKARSLALSGIQVAMAQLADISTVKQDKQSEKKPSAAEKKKKFFAALIKTLNMVQTFKLSKKVEGIDGTIKLCITCEEGKLNLNHLWNVEKKQFVHVGTPQKEVMQRAIESLFATIEKASSTENLLGSFEGFMKKRGYVLNDVTELLLIQEYERFADALFFDPQEKETIFLCDLFTLWTKTMAMDPWVFSQSWQNVLRLSKTMDAVDELIEQFTPQTTWKTAWDNLFVSFYQKNFNSLPKSIDSILNTTFEPNLFSVLSYGVVGSSTVKLLAIVELVEKQSKEGSSEVEIKVRKLYWL